MRPTQLAMIATILLAAGRAHAGTRTKIVSAARHHVGRAFSGDCSGFVEKVLDEAGHPIQPANARTGSEGLYRALRPVRRPRPGDLAFFHDTVDRDRDGRVDDAFTHVALVESVRGNQVTLIHRGSRGVARLHLDLRHRHDRRRNSTLRWRRAGDPPGTRYLAGELLTGFAAPFSRARRR